jgi:hypothetical protein
MPETNLPTTSEPNDVDAPPTPQERFEDAARILALGIRRLAVRRKNREDAVPPSDPALATDGTPPRT